jgi:hypothetical protein
MLSNCRETVITGESIEMTVRVIGFCSFCEHLAERLCDRPRGVRESETYTHYRPRARGRARRSERMQS